MVKCCGLCPYSRKNTLYVHPARAEEFAYAAENPCNDFVCHKTGVVDESDGEGYGDIVRGRKSMTCAGFHAMQHILNGTEEHSEIKIDYSDHFSDVWEMTYHHENKY